MTDKFQDKYRIQSSRADWHGYNGGMYFVTICTAGRECHFGEIRKDDAQNVSNNKMHYTAIGKYVDDQIRNVTNHYKYATIPLWVVMPNHIHLVVLIDGDNVLDGVHTVSTEMRWKSDVVNEKMQIVSSRKGRLSVVIGGLKRAVTQYAHVNKIPFAWQPRFHDHIVRDFEEINRISVYIENNVQLWETDCYTVNQ